MASRCKRRYCDPAKFELARKMRANMTVGESVLWQALRAVNKVHPLGHRFKRQQVMWGWIADFWCPAVNLIVEVDGGYHEQRAEADKQRDAILLGKGIRTLRFTNRQVTTDLQGCIATIRAAIAATSRD